MRNDPFNLGDLIDRARDLTHPAIVDLRIPDAPKTFSYDDMDRLSGGIARYLEQRQFPHGTRIAVASLNRAEYVAAYFGIMRAGHVVVPVNIKLADDVIDYVVKDSDIVLAFADAATRGRLPAGLEVIDFDSTGADGFAQLITPAQFETVVPAAGDIAQILYTSGSSGRPKGVPLTHAGQLWVLRSKELPDLSHERQILAQPLFHMNGLIVIKCAFLSGASMVMMPSFNAATYTETLARYRITSALAIPTMFARVVKELGARKDLDLSALKQVVLASAPLTMALIERVQRAIPGATVANYYGTTEAGAGVFGKHPKGVPVPPLSLGYPLPGSEVMLVDGPNENEGTLLMRNPATMSGYLNLPDRTKAVLSDGWYFSGDVMRRDAGGFFYFLGRSDDMFVCSGENIFPNEVEKLLERHPLVQQAAVVPLPDDERGQIPVAFIVPAAGERPTVEAIKQFTIQHGPAYQHPRRIEFRVDMPLAGTNKIDRRALTERAQHLETSRAWSQ